MGAETSGFRESDPDMPIQSQLSYGSSMFLRFPWPVCNLLYFQVDTTHPRTPRKMRHMPENTGKRGKKPQKLRQNVTTTVLHFAIHCLQMMS